MADLIVLVADKNMQGALEGILDRHHSLRIREVEYKVIPFVSKADPGCYNSAHEMLRGYCIDYQHALVLFDYSGCGHEDMPVEDIEERVKRNLYASGWDNRSEVVVIDPELENWVWSDSPQVEECLGWVNRSIRLRDWLVERRLLEVDTIKPVDPKRAMEEVLYEVRKPRSSMIYRDLASKVSLQRCEDRAFCRLKEILHEWFSEEECG